MPRPFLLKKKDVKKSGILLLSFCFFSVSQAQVKNRAPLLEGKFIKLPVTAFRPGGWLRRQLELQREGLTGHLGEISIWLEKKDNAWLAKDGKGKYGWEELPYWLKGYADIAYMLRDSVMIRESLFWINTVLKNQRADGDFGPAVVRNGNRDLWTNMPMLWCLQSYYEYSRDPRVLKFMSRYFKWELSIPDEHFLEDYWEKSRGGDNMLSVYWLYNRTGEPWLLDLATKIDRNTADWRQENNLPNWHNVNIAQCFREPATYYLQSHKKSDLDATYNDFALIRTLYGQVPGGMFGADENARKGYDDPRQAVETCGMVEQMTSDEFLLQMTGDTKWAENCEDVAFNTFPAAFMPDYRSLRYLTAPNMVVSDSRNHAPGIANEGPFLMMNPFSSRCCQHNHAAGWVYYAENAWMATPDNGLAAQLYVEGTVTAKAGGQTVSIEEKTHYPFDEHIEFTIKTKSASLNFPLYLRIPAWCTGARVDVNGKESQMAAEEGYVKIARAWKSGDRVSLVLPMALKLTSWARNKNSVSVNYGPLGFSLKIDETYQRKDSRTTAQGDAGWQASADAGKWPAFEILPASDWNYGLELDSSSFEVEKGGWPADNNPFTNAAAPIILKAKGRKIDSWTIDQYGLCGVLPQSPVATNEPLKELTLVPMGGARLRISSFPVVGAATTYTNPLLPSGPDPYSCYKDGYYYYTHTMGNRLDLWKTKDITDLRHAEHKTIYTPPAGTEWSRDLWAPEVMFLDGKWYAYYAADGGNNKGHRLYVLENDSSDPMNGEWVFKGKITDATDKWAIDGDVFRYKGRLYMVWSGWEGDDNGEQDIYIARMKDPLTIESQRVKIGSPEYGWEKIGDIKNPKDDPPHINVNEGPQGLVHGDDLFVIYSASACWTDNYALGMLRYTGKGDILDPAAWKKSDSAVFKQSPANGIYATGHNSFFLSPDGKENWILYHANSKPGQGCGNTRAPRAQRFTWNANGEPVFGEPVKDNVPLPVPSR
ncbi:MAG: glycoside hydrolase family 127 protein [Bacteroidetes bacterium]|nr:glycoside hydrolase family 127 protein [Bacteroidota bacterium]